MKKGSHNFHPDVYEDGFWLGVGENINYGFKLRGVTWQLIEGKRKWPEKIYRDACPLGKRMIQKAFFMGLARRV